MASLDDFQSILKEVVHAKRLSASKMGKLTEIALKSMENDTQLVSILYRTHKSLPTIAKVSSLYVFDALSRAARHQANKQNITGDINSPIGNCATFLLKVEGVLEGLFQDMITVGSTESKDKTKKILDIWVKGNTFPSKILSQLMEVVKETEKVPEMKTFTTSDPRTVVQSAPTPPVSTESSPPATDPQATLLALLTQAANAAVVSNSAQTTANTGLVSTGLDPAQLAVLQQLALAQTASSGAPPEPSQPAPRMAPAPSGSTFPAQSSYRDEYSSTHKDRKYDRRQSTERANSHSDHPDDRSNTRGSFRGAFRGRGRGDGRRWDDRDRDRYGDREKDWSPSHRGRRSRSRSPPSRYAGRRDGRPYSPPRRPLGPTMSRGQRDYPDSSTRDVEKDEFGRDIRPQSPDSDSTPRVISTQPPPHSPPINHRTVDSPPALTSNHERMSLSPLVAANTSSSTPSAPIVSNTVSAQPGMESFNPMTFDFTSPPSWEALGKMWQVTHGYLPTTEQLMQFVMSAGAGPMASQPVSEQNWVQPSGQEWRGNSRGRGRGGFVRGRGTFGHGNGRNVHEAWTQNDSNQTTDAIVLGETNPMDVSGGDDSPIGSPSQSRGGGLGGKMQRIGDKWVFVRDPSAGGT